MANDRTKKLGANIRAERNRKGLSQDQLSEKVDVASRTISSIENGYQKPSIFIVFDIANALEIDINELLKNL